MAADDQDRRREAEAELEAEIDSELERVGENPKQVDAGKDSLGTQSAPSGTPHGEPGADEEGKDGEDGEEDEEAEAAEGASVPDDAATSQEEAQELPDEQQRERWEHAGGDEELAREAVADEGAPEDENDEDDEDAEGADEQA
jgi:hypothetical protein